MTQVVSVVGARPQFVKAAVVSRAFRDAGVEEGIVHTGQHYDEELSGRFLADLGISNVLKNLAVGSGSHSHQTAQIMIGFHELLDNLDRPPDTVVVYGDTNSTVAAGLVAAKRGIPLVHVEAGLRSFNREMPEEVNRVITDHVSALHFCSSHLGVANLAREGIIENVYDVGDVMLDAFQVFGADARRLIDSDKITGLSGEAYVLATIHRPSNTDDPARFKAVLNALGLVNRPVVWPVHPRNKAALAYADVPENVRCIRPVGYLEMRALLDACSAVITDSGGLQKEAHWARRPCVTLRGETEWLETLDGGWNVLCNLDLDEFAAIVNRTPSAPWQMLYGDGRSAERIVETIIVKLLRNKGRSIGPAILPSKTTGIRNDE